jgi:mRNA interferase MazF
MARRPAVIWPKRGEIYLVNFDLTIGAEIQKTRPTFIVQNGVANRHSPITIAAAITSRFDEPLSPRKFLSSRLRAA